MTKLSSHHKLQPDHQISPDRVKKIRVLKENLPFFSKTALRIRTKKGELLPLVLNRAQLYVHQRLEDQKRRTGKVRALILKGRQQGMSTYVGARFYHKTAFNPEATTFILSHQAKTTGPLFDMVKRYHEHMPEVLRPQTDTSNKNQLKFAFPQGQEDEEIKNLISEYTVGTAGNEDIGRGMTIKYLHCSEAAYYDKTDELETGLFQAVADLPGTEIILESTANGMGNMFYRKTIDALAGRGDFELIFVPWFWQIEYRYPLPDGFELTPDERELAEQYDLDDNQIMWRRKKIETLGSLTHFQREYPCDPLEAFVISGDGLFDKQKLIEARKSTIKDLNSPVILGVDCARGGDRTVIVGRRGREIFHLEVLPPMPGDTGEPSVQLAEILKKRIDRFNAAKVFIDMGQGYGVVDILRASGYKKVVQGVYFNQGALESDLYLNKRTEMFLTFRDWLHEGGVNIPDDDAFFTEAAIIPDHKETPTRKKFMPPKAEIKVKLGMSTDIIDATILTFAFPVRSDILTERKSVSVVSQQKRSPYQTVNRINQSRSTKSSISVKVNH